MILIDLLGDDKRLVEPATKPAMAEIPKFGMKTNPHALPLIAALIGLFFSGALFPHLTTTTAAPRPLFVDERETVVAAFTALPSRVPELSGWIEDVKAQYVDGDVEAVLADDTEDGQLLKLDGETLQFSRSFFDSDPAAQEGALLEAVLAIHQDVSRTAEQPAEIAVADE